MKNKIEYDKKLFARVDRSIISLKNNGGEYDLDSLSPYDRKKIHFYIARNYSDILSKSRGEGKNRKIFLSIKKKKETKKVINKLTIDINGDSI